MADCLSRFPVEEGSKLLDDELILYKVECIGYNKHDEWVNTTCNDKSLSAVIKRWPSEKSNILDMTKPYWTYAMSYPPTMVQYINAYD